MSNIANLTSMASIAMFGDAESVAHSMSEGMRRSDSKDWNAAAQTKINAHLENLDSESLALKRKKGMPCC